MKAILPILALLLPATAAETFRAAKVTQAINEVQVYLGDHPARPASVGEKISLPSSVQTGRRSRTELTFNDSSITRLGQNSVFSFREGGRNVELKQGSILLQVPKNAGGATIRTATVTAAITGTTVMFEYSPGSWIKLLTLEGTQKLSFNGSNRFVIVPAGKMIIMDPNSKVIPEPVTVDLKKLLASSPLAGEGTFGRLPAKAWDAIWETIKEQQKLKDQGILLPTDFVISGPGFRNARSIADAAVNLRKVRSDDERPSPPKPPDPPTRPTPVPSPATPPPFVPPNPPPSPPRPNNTGP